MKLSEYLVLAVEQWEEEIVWKREHKTNKEILKDEERPMSAVAICPKWKGGWLRMGKGQEMTESPTGCGARYCEVCGPRVIWKERQELQQGYYEAFGTRPAKMATLTYRARDSWDDIWGYRSIETWGNFVTRTGANVGLRIWPEYDNFTMKQLRDWWQGWNPYERVILRAQLTPKQWVRLMTAHFQVLRREWKATFNEDFHYACYWELTKQGTPHMHLAYVVPEAVLEVGKRRGHEIVLQELKRIWGKAVGEDKRVVQVHAGDPEYNNSESALAYIMKYASEVGEIVSKHYERGRAELLNEWVDLDWNYKIRRMRKSDSWPRADIGDRGVFQTVEGRGFSRREWKRRANLARYHLFGTDNYARMLQARTWGEEITEKSTAETVRDAVVHWKDAKEVVQRKQLDTGLNFPEKQPEVYEQNTNFPWEIRVQGRDGRLTSPRGGRWNGDIH